MIQHYSFQAYTRRNYDIANTEINQLFNLFCSNRPENIHMVIRSAGNKSTFTDHKVYINDVNISWIGNNLSKLQNWISIIWYMILAWACYHTFIWTLA